MRTELIHICDKCGKTSIYKEDIELCETSHLGLTLEEYKYYGDLKKAVRQTSYIVSVTKNEHTECNYDRAIGELIEFEKQHNLKVL